MSNEKSRTLEVQATEVHRAEIVEHEGPLMLPKNMTTMQAIKLLKERHAFLQSEVTINRTYDAFPWDGAIALAETLKKRFGWVPSRRKQSLFGSNPPATINVDVALGKTRQVPWGRVGLPGLSDEEFLETNVAYEDGRACFQVYGTVLRKNEDFVNGILQDVADEIAANSIYKGQALSIRFRDDDGDSLDIPAVKFIPTDIPPESLILARTVEDAVETNLLTPIRRADDCMANGIAVKRGILLGGAYGTGKTMAAAVAAHEAVHNGVTYLYVPRADELREAIQFSRRYADPACVVFCEDIDRVMNGERSVRMDDLLNVIDGIDGKNSNIIVVLTTNFLENINPAMLRPGRLDSVIEVTAPDAEAVQRLLRHYGGEAIAEDTDLAAVGEQLDGMIPAVIAEVVKRAKLAELRRLPIGDKVTHISEAALMEAAITMTRQLELLNPKEAEPEPTLDSAMRNLVNGGPSLTSRDVRTATAKGILDVVKRR